MEKNRDFGHGTFDFKTTKGEQLLVSTAISGVSMEGAARNLAAEVPDDDFDKYLAAARKTGTGICHG